MTKFHLLGIGGAGMSVVAELLARQGGEVSGSDRQDGPALAHLRDLGVTVYVGHDAAQVPADAVVVYSSAVKKTNPEYAVALERGQKIWHRSEALAYAARNHDFIAVAGAHGKSTTSGMLARSLSAAGLDPSYAVGATVSEHLDENTARTLHPGTGAHLGSGPVFVAEADESDGSFLNYQPRIEVITNIEPDHLDHYASRQNFEDAFLQFTGRLVPGGLVIICTDDAGGARLHERLLAAKAIGQSQRVLAYGRNKPANDVPFLQVVDDESQAGPRSIFKLEPNEAAAQLWPEQKIAPSYDLSLQVAGLHNHLNAAASWACGLELGVEGVKMAACLQSFVGTGRRFEKVGEADGVTVIDDYGHHPTEVRATLETARKLQQDKGRILVLFQPHLYSRTKNFAPQFASSLLLADQVVVCSVYPAREEPSAGVEGDQIVRQMSQIELSGEAQTTFAYIADKHMAAQYLAQQAKPGDLVLTLGAGDVTELAPEILDILAGRQAA